MHGMISVTGNTLTIQIEDPPSRVSLPLRSQPLADERQWCRRAHELLDGEDPDAASCTFYAHGQCLGSPGKPCLLDAPDDPGWNAVRRWATTPQGLAPVATALQMKEEA